MIKLILFFPVIAFLIACSNESSYKYNEIDLRILVEKALKGEEDANQKLSGLIDSENYNYNHFNQLTVKSELVEGKKFLAVLLEYPDPTLNLLAIYDEDLNFYLLDKSLSGNLTVEWREINSSKFIFVQEKFLTKDVLELTRLSLYGFYNATPGKALSLFTNFKQDSLVYTQTIKKFSNDLIATEIRNSDEDQLTEKVDTFYFNDAQLEFESSKNHFSNFVKSKIDSFNWILIKPQIIDLVN